MLVPHLHVEKKLSPTKKPVVKKSREEHAKKSVTKILAEPAKRERKEKLETDAKVEINSLAANGVLS